MPSSVPRSTGGRPPATPGTSRSSSNGGRKTTASRCSGSKTSGSDSGSGSVLAYRVAFSERFLRSLEKIPRSVASRVGERLALLEVDPRPSWSKRLRGFRTFRFRVGDYRVLYDVDDEARTVTVRDVAHRSSVYRDL